MTLSSPSPHIAFLVASPGVPVGGPSGSARHVEAMVRAFLALGHRVTLLASAGGACDCHPLPPSSPASGRGGLVARESGLLDRSSCRVHILPPPPCPRWIRSRSRQECFQARAFAREARRLLASDPPDLIYERYTLFSDAGIRLARHFEVPCLLEVNAPLRLERTRYFGYRGDRAARRAERAILAGADRLFCVSRPLMDYLRVEAGLPTERLEWLPNGVDLERFQPRALSESLRCKMGLEGQLVVGFAGSLKPWHGLDRWLEIFARAHARAPGARGLVVGDGPGRSEMEQRARAMGLEPIVRFVGQVAPEKMPEYLSQMDVLLAPYPPLEPFYFSPLKIFEALAMGIPVITSEQGDLADLVGEGGATYPPEAINAAVGLLLRALTKPELRRRWSRAGRLQVEGRDWTVVAGKVLREARGGHGGEYVNQPFHFVLHSTL